MEKSKQNMPTHSRYEWGAKSPISHVAIRKDQKYPTAYLSAGEAISAAQLAEIPDQLHDFGWKSFADVVEGKPVLRVWGFETDSQLLGALKNMHMVQGKAQQTERALEKKQSAIGWVKDNSVVTAGLTYMIGDALLATSGVLRKDKNQIAAGAQWGATSALLALFGTKDPASQMDRLYRQMDDYLEKSDVQLTGADKRVLDELRARGDGFWVDIKNTLSDHLIFINNAVFGFGGVNMTKAGLFQDKNLLKATSGAAVTAGMWGSLLIPEDEEAGMSRGEIKAKHEAEKQGETFDAKPVDAFQKPWTWLKRKPLRLAGMGAGLNNVLMGTSGWLYEFPKKRALVQSAVVGSVEHGKALAEMRGAMCDGMTPAAYVVANTFYGMSPKDRRGFLKEDGYLDELYSVAAHIFAELPQEERGVRLAQFAGFMSTLGELKSTSEEVYEALEARIEALESNPWSGQTHKREAPDTQAELKDAEHMAMLAPQAQAETTRQ